MRRRCSIAGCAAAPADAVALFGRASIDYEMGRSEAALDGYAAVLRALGPRARTPARAAQIAPVAAARLNTLL